MKCLEFLVIASVLTISAADAAEREEESSRIEMSLSNQEGARATQLARPSAVQYAYHELERIMFVHFHPGTWHGVEYDDGKTDLREINPMQLDTDQWCEVAKSWDAKMILYVAKHCGGFCWWQTDTTDYSIKNTPYQDGQGDVLKEIADSCRQHGLKFGVYVYPGDPHWGAGIGSGGKTQDPARQEEYSKVLRQQLTEAWSKYGPIDEAWFDGSCQIPVGDLVDKYLRKAVILQSPQANIRWVGNEAGEAPYPAWNSLKSSELRTGLATAAHGNPDGDAWAPLECDVPLYNHKWLWSPENERLRRSVDELVQIYYKSVGRGAVMLLNATPNTDGLIPVGDIARYRELGDELNRRFAEPLGQTHGQGVLHTIEFERPTRINQFMIMEDYRQGERIREYVVEARTQDGRWETIDTGSSVGRKRIVMFRPVEATRVALRITRSVGEPLIRGFRVYSVGGDNEFLYERPALGFDAHRNGKWHNCGKVVPAVVQDGVTEIEFDLRPYITKPGQFLVCLDDLGGSKFRIESIELLYNGREVLAGMLSPIVEGELYNINRTAAVVEKSKITLKLKVRTDKAEKTELGLSIKRTL